jgi:uncharacterized protein YkwD
VRARLTVRCAGRVGGAVCAATAAFAMCVGTAGATPLLTSARFVRSPTIGRVAQLELRATDPAEPIGEVAVAFGRNEGVFGLGACRPPDSSGRTAGGAFAPGATSTFTVPHAFTGTRPRPVLIRLASGGCGETGVSVVERLTVTPTRPGAPAAPLAPPVVVAVTGVPGLTGVTGGSGSGGAGGVGGSLPGVSTTVPSLPGVPTLPTLPGGIPLPGTGGALPGTGGLPTVGGALPTVGGTVPTVGGTLPTLKVTSAAAECRFATAVPGTSAPGLARAHAAVLCLLNRQRRRFGERPLRESHELDRAAALHDIRMVRGGFFSHLDPNGFTLVRRLQLFHYITARVSWTVGENLGIGVGGASTPAALVNAWMASTEHRSNILDAAFRQIGIAITRGVPGSPARGVTYTTDFGARR